MPDLPTGTVTFLFTDIEGSTRLWEQEPEAMRQALAYHDALLRSAIEHHSGRVFKTVGDAFYAVFASAPHAAHAALDAQCALHTDPIVGAPLAGALHSGTGHPQGVPLRVRMALHTGPAEVRDDDYFGPALNRVARLLAASHGGQVLLSQPTADLLRSSLPADTHLRLLGMHRLRDIATVESIYQLLSPSLPSDFPPLNTLDVAFRRGLRRAAAIAAVIVVALGALALAAVYQARRAERLARAERRQRTAAEERQRMLRRERYAAQMSVAQQAWDAGDVGRALHLLGAQRPGPGQEDLRGFEWRYLWRLCQQGDALFTLRGHKAWVRSVAFSPNGKTLASGSDDGMLKLWNVASHQEVATFRAHRNWIWRVAFSPDSHTLATASADETVSTLATGSGDNTVKRWSVVARRDVGTLKGHTNSVWSVAFSPDGKTLATGSYDRTVRLWNVATEEETGTLTGYARSVSPVAFSPDGKTLAIGSGAWNRDGSPGEAKLWDVATRQEVATLRGHARAVWSVAFSPKGKILATGSGDKTARLWDVVSGREVATFKGHRGGVLSVVFSPDGKTLATGSQDTTVKLWDVDTKRETATLKGHNGWVFGVAFSSNGKSLATAGGNIVKLWDAAAPRQPATLQGLMGTVFSMAFSPDGKTLATGNQDRSVKLWNVATQQEVATLTGHQAPVWCVAFSRDGNTLASGSADATLRLWRAASFVETDAPDARPLRPGGP